MQQDRLTSGDTLNFCTVTPCYPASAGWSLHYKLFPPAPGEPTELVSIPDGDTHLVHVAPLVTSTWPAGTYTWASWIDRSGEVYSIGSGRLQVLPNPRLSGAGWDGRSESQKALDDARAALRAWNPSVKRYKIFDREREFNSVSEILKLINLLEFEVKREAAGGTLPTSGRIFYRRR